jgi:hypothetical protein
MTPFRQRGFHMDLVDKIKAQIDRVASICRVPGDVRLSAPNNILSYQEMCDDSTQLLHESMPT